MQTYIRKKLNIFTQAVDQCYSSQAESIDYYSYDGCNIKDIDKMLNKSKITDIDEDIQADNSTAGIFSDEEKTERFFLTKQLLVSDWTLRLNNLKADILENISNREIFKYSKPHSGRKLTFDSASKSKEEIDK